MIPLVQGILIGCVIIASIFLHELGHWVAYFFHSGKVFPASQILVSRKGIEMNMSSGLTNWKYFWVLVTGILVGYFPIIIAYDYLGLLGEYGFAALTGFYLAGCTHDFKQMIQVVKNK